MIPDTKPLYRPFADLAAFAHATRDAQTAFITSQGLTWDTARAVKDQEALRQAWLQSPEYAVLYQAASP